MNAALNKLGIIFIGRNEGERILKAVESFPASSASVIYVDSGSTDGSVDLIISKGINVHSLSPEKPFTAARGRKEGAEIMLKEYPDVRWIQFIDGDCALDPLWCDIGVEYLQSHDEVGIVCGILVEEKPELSHFNRMNALRWSSAPIGEIEACGGIFLARREAYEQSGGFNEILLTGEEAEFCLRVRSSGYLIMRLNKRMAIHDSDLISLKSWWKRAIWGGYGDALRHVTIKHSNNNPEKRKIRSSFIWGLFMPFIFSVGILGSFFNELLIVLPAIVLILYIQLLLRLIIRNLKNGNGYRDSYIYSYLTIVRKVPHSLGYIKFFLYPKNFNKRPDPHNNNRSI